MLCFFACNDRFWKSKKLISDWENSGHWGRGDGKKEKTAFYKWLLKQSKKQKRSEIVAPIFTRRNTSLNNPRSKSRGIIIFRSCQFSYLRITERILNVFLFFLLAVSSEPHQIHRIKKWIKKSRDTNFLCEW